MKQLDLTNETPIVFSEAPKLLPKRQGKKVHYSTVYRWATKGVRGRVLETAMVGGVRYTSVEAIGRFLSAPMTERAAAPVESPMTAELLAVQRNLDQAGL